MFLNFLDLEEGTEAIDDSISIQVFLFLARKIITNIVFGYISFIW